MFGNVAVLSLLVWSVVWIAGNAAADCERVEAGGANDSTMPLRISQISVGRDIPVGTEVYRQVFTPGGVASIRCAPGTRDINLKRNLEMVSGSIPGYPPGVNGNTYPTNLAGIGVRFLDVDNRAFPFTAKLPDCPGPQACVFRDPNLDKFTLSLVKVSAHVQAGPVVSASLPIVNIGYEIRGRQLPVRRVRLSGQLRVVSQTCQAPNIQVSLGQHSVGTLEKTGYTPWQDFSIVLNHCPGFYGYYSAGANVLEPGVVFKTNKIAFRIDPTQRAVSPDEGILSLTAQGPRVERAAQGIGVQLALENTQPIRLSTLLDSGISLQPKEGGSYVIALKARYLRLPNSTVHSGPANATAIFTINYQ
ncbi:fimbrial protein [Pseudomonas sp. MF6787]|uniref:fimbrial protein n=1 Tax=Pseudomonas sp. MF6787 TaxID=2797536 RepID=UPI0018E84BE0|nr:fimbrial protein [Pseudomonas sp. MF6787]MBJ2260369.1 type 1 fimbrial protein [Pseudomonas sp. MF6787]